MPPPFHPSRKPAPVTKAAAGKIDPDTSTPVTRLLATNHARKSSQAVDPFVTPFDDEHRVNANARSDDPFSATSPPVMSNPFETPACGDACEGEHADEPVRCDGALTRASSFSGPASLGLYLNIVSPLVSPLRTAIVTTHQL
ncbi:hypothetical protein ONZ51_g2463 [Trametes cubensis]|uniref:Uncharacterized protein n=1 Tax=Trametes cubensis TaxID=1111947 RepID=A0AAD7U049_9APHY|nr:hypothetical protein ONZ51_g2463 [Trametes cubensis]